MRIVHLGFEDYRRPGAGGGSYRNFEVNKRLASTHEITVVTAAYPGCNDRIEDGVEYRHIGAAGTSPYSLLSYFALLPKVIAGYRKHEKIDLLVEEFAPPTSTFATSARSGLPTCANVQWLFGAAKAREYHLPGWSFGTAERWGVRQFGYFVALSDDLAEQIRAIRPDAVVTVAGMGITVPALDPWPTVEARSSLFLGRLDVDHKGLDLLIDALALLPPGSTTLTIAGDGAGRDALERRIARLGLGHIVRFVGRVDGDEKWRLLARSQVVVMPSRRETYGLSALEALGSARPVLSFDIPCLREVVRPEHGVLVSPFDVPRYAAAWQQLLDEPELCDALGARGALFARAHTWDKIAALQADAYEVARNGRV